MRRNILTKLSFFMAVLMLISACGTKKRTVKIDSTLPKATNNEQLLKNFELSNLNYHTFSGRAKAKVQMGKDSQNVTLNLRIDRGKAIWISVTALLGIEAARVMITPDSVKIMNKMQGEYIAKPFSYIYKYTNPNISYKMLEDILLGNISVEMLRTEQLQVASSTDDVQIIGVRDGLTFHYGVNNANRPFNFNLMELGKSNKLEATYSDYQMIGGYNFPNRFTLNIEGDGVKVNSDLAYNKAEFNTTAEMPFKVPSSYKVIN
ncbi:DUF4292 domain-containing protein [Sphingobacterium lactis]|uniref:DUF4292 domain-containing protein n=1 Tax=Sphingobacterium lactis TaxID=797291 RepID=UPI003F7D9028